MSWVKEHRALWVSAGLYLSTAAFLLRAWLQPGVLPGHANSEAPQRLWELHQLLRWFSGEAPFGHADLIAFPDGRPFWPAMPVADLLMLPMVGALGDALAFSVLALALLALAGLGPYVLARGLGARAPAAFAAGLLLQLNPMMLRNLEDCVLEMACVGLPCLAAAAMLRVFKGQRAAWAGVFAWTALTALSSPYLAVFLALACAAVAVASWRRWRTWLAIAGVCAAANLSALAPLALVEGEAGRMGHEGGFVIAPPPIVYPDGAPYTGPKGVHSAGGASKGALGRKAPKAKPSPVLRVVARWPAGVMACLGLLLGLLHPRSRPWAALGIAFFVLGPGIPSVSRALGVPGQALEGPLQRALSALPLMKVLGNPTRMLLLVTALAGLAWAQLVQQRWPAAVLLALGVGGELWMLRPELALPAHDDPTDAQVVQALSGPYMVVPSGQPPLWMPGLARGDALLYGGRAQVPHSYDLGAGEQAGDVAAVRELGRAAGLPMARSGRSSAPVDWSALPQRQVIVVHAVLEPSQREDLEAALAVIGHRVVQGTRADLWQLRDP